MSRFLAAVAAAVLSLLPTLAAAAVEGHRVWHDGREITIVDQDGWAMYDGDIVIGRTADVLARSAQAGPDGRAIGAIAKSVVNSGTAARWPRGASGLFEMPYVVETDPDGNVPAAVQAFNDQLAGFLRAVPRTTEADYVAFTLSASDTSGACSSNVGRVGGRQMIQGSRLCSGGTLVHEMGHAIGLYHEQEHSDRAAYVVIDLNAVEPARASNFSQGAIQRSVTPYDFASIMHYAATSFAKPGATTMETIPPGIGIGARASFSAADVEGIKRLYGAPPTTITVTSFPAGLTVVVDGAPVVTPATFNWALGSTHTIDVPSGAQVAGGTAHVFARWNVDRDGDLAARRTVTVSAGDGSPLSSASAPAVSTYTANFTRYKEVRLTTAGNRAGIGGSLAASPAPQPLAGLAGVYYRERQAFTLEAAPGAGATFGNWGGSYFFFTPFTTVHRNPFRGPVFFSDALPAAYEYRATFYDIPLLRVRAQAQDGEALGLRATVTRSGASGTDERLPYNGTNWASGQSGTLTVGTLPVNTFATTMRYTFRDWDGDPAATASVTSPAAGQPDRVVTANFNKEYQAFKQVIPSCAGTMTLPGDPGGWYAHGSNLPVTLTPAPGWTFTGWEGSLSGTSLTPTYAVTDFPNLVARFNTTSAPLTLASVSPSSFRVGTAGTVTLEGTGFTPATEVYLGAGRFPATFVSANRLTMTFLDDQFLVPDSTSITVVNRAGAGACTVSASRGFDVGNASAGFTPQTGWWWNPAESGRGFFIEQRGGNLFMAGYLYETDGRATWFTAGGPALNGAFVGAMTTFRGGQTLTGNYVAPAPGASPGSLTLRFTAPDRATLDWPGGRTSLERFVFGSGAAALPESGWWWNPSESGRGFSIETQGNAIFLAGFMYDAAGNPVWYTGQGTVANNAYAGSWQQFANGQSLAGAYRTPILLDGNVGALTLVFTGPRSANLTLPNGRVLALTRFDF